MPPLLHDDDEDDENSDEESPSNGVPNHTESTIEADVEAKNQLKDDLMSDIEETKGRAAARAERDRVSSPGSNEDTEEEEEVYEVEEIQGHEFKKKKLFYNVKWKGFEVSENTLEPEENLLTSKLLLAEYHHKIGGAPQPPSKAHDLKSKNSRKSLRNESGVSATEDSPAPPAKRHKKGKREQSVGSDDLDLDGKASGVWEPKGSNWEDQVARITTIERDEKSEDLYIYVEFKNGKKSRIKSGRVRKTCPQKLLDFYEAHLSV